MRTLSYVRQCICADLLIEKFVTYVMYSPDSNVYSKKVMCSHLMRCHRIGPAPEESPSGKHTSQDGSPTHGMTVRP